jgi:pimeloyl-ACP methyl ester carboxylesterase
VIDVTIKTVRLERGTIRYRDEGPTGGESIVFVHGLLVNSLLWRKVTPPLVEQGFRCVAPDWPLGSHDLPMPADADLSPPGIAGLIDSFLEALSLENVTLVGNDTGGAMSQVTAAEYPRRIGRLVLTNCDAYENFPPPEFKSLLLLPKIPGATFEMYQGLRLKAVRRKFFQILQATPLDHEVLDAYFEPGQRSRAVRRDANKVMRGIDARHTLAAAEKLSREFHEPVLLAWGTRDPFFTLETAQRLARDLPDTRLVEIPTSKTFVPEDAPERLADLIASFVRETVTRNAGRSA